MTDDSAHGEPLVRGHHPPSDDDPRSAVAVPSAQASVTPEVEQTTPGLPVATSPARRTTPRPSGGRTEPPSLRHASPGQPAGVQVPDEATLNDEAPPTDRLEVIADREPATPPVGHPPAAAAPPDAPIVSPRPNVQPPSWPPALPAEQPAGETALVPKPSSRWRRAVASATFGLIDPGPSAWDLREIELRRIIATPLRQPYKIAIVGGGGAGKTTVAVCVGSVLAELRQDRVVAVAADTGFGALSPRIDPVAVESYRELAFCPRPQHFADMRTRLGVNAAGLFVLPEDRANSPASQLDPDVYRRAVDRLDDHFAVTLIDCGPAVNTPVIQEVLATADAIVAVTPLWADGALVTRQMLEWLAGRGYVEPLRRALVVINDTDGHAGKQAKSSVAEMFSELGHPIFGLPFDAGLRDGGLIDVVNGIASSTRRCLFEIAARLSWDFGYPRTTATRR